MQPSQTKHHLIPLDSPQQGIVWYCSSPKPAPSDLWSLHKRAKGPTHEPTYVWATLVRFSRICGITQMLRHESITYLPGNDLPLGWQGLAGAMTFPSHSESPQLSRALQLVRAVLDGMLALWE